MARLGLLNLRLEWLILVLFVAQAVARGRLLGIVGASRLSLPVWIASSSLLVIVLLLNWQMPGMALGAAGILMNMDVVILNMAMPVVLNDPIGFETVASAAEVAKSSGYFYRVAGSMDVLPWLGDALLVPWGQSALLVSPGDVVLMVAVAVVIVDGMTPHETKDYLTRPLIG